MIDCHTYPDHETYAILYARYFNQERLDKLLNRLPFRVSTVLDLCCGTGRATFEAIRRGAREVIAVDERADMFSPAMHNRSKIIPLVETVDEILWRPGSRREWTWAKPRVVICQQAINYWLTRERAEKLHELMKPGGVFAFNTFVNRPSEIPRTMSYDLNGRQYWECSYLIGNVLANMVHHIQACQGIPPHVTAFKWLSQETIESMLDGLFDVKVEIDGSSAIYRCTAS